MSSHFSLAAFKIFSLPLALSIFSMICLFVDLFVFILLEVVELSGCVDYFSIHLRTSAIKVFKYFSALFFPLFRYSPYMYVVVCYPTFLWGSIHFSSSFSFCSSDCIICINLSSSLLVLSSDSSNLLSNPSSKFF